MSKCEVINNGAKRREMTGRSAVLLSISRHCVEEKDWRRVLRFEDFFFFLALHTVDSCPQFVFFSTRQYTEIFVSLCTSSTINTTV